TSPRGLRHQPEPHYAAPARRSRAPPRPFGCARPARAIATCRCAAGPRTRPTETPAMAVASMPIPNADLWLPLRAAPSEPPVWRMGNLDQAPCRAARVRLPTPAAADLRRADPGGDPGHGLRAALRGCDQPPGRRRRAACAGPRGRGGALPAAGVTTAPLRRPGPVRVFALATPPVFCHARAGVGVAFAPPTGPAAKSR